MSWVRVFKLPPIANVFGERIADGDMSTILLDGVDLYVISSPL